MPDRPNVLVVLCDQLRRSAVGYAGDPNVETPNIDRLAERGVWFENACSTYPVCVPARFTMMTGEYPHTRSVPAIDYGLSPAERTVADELGEAGYRTAYLGKWHLAGTHRYQYHDGDTDRGRRINRTPIPEDQRGGFEFWQGFELRNDHFDTAYFDNDDTEPTAIEGYQTDGLFGLAGEYVRDAAGGDPFFAVLSVEPPHFPTTAPEEYLREWRGADLEMPPTFDPDPAKFGAGGGDLRAELGMDRDLRDDIRAYYAMVENLDDNVGALLAELRDAGIREETAVVFLSDHGDLLYNHGLNGKQYPYEESVGIPFVVSHPGGDIREGARVSEPVGLEDWYSTVRGLAGLDPLPGKPGTDLTPLLRGDDSLDREGILLEFVAELRDGLPFHDEPWRGFRTERYKYTVKGGPEGMSPWQLFDLDADPHEQENLVDDPEYEAVARDLHGNLRRRLVQTGDTVGLRPAFGHDGLSYWT
jgi:arylsulfatase A-like enzyme